MKIVPFWRPSLVRIGLMAWPNQRKAWKMSAGFTERVFGCTHTMKSCNHEPKKTTRIRGAVTLLSKDCTRTFIIDLQKNVHLLWSRGFFSGILGQEKGLLQGDGWLSAATRLGWRLQCIGLYGNVVYYHKASSRSRHHNFSSVFGNYHSSQSFYSTIVRSAHRCISTLRKCPRGISVLYTFAIDTNIFGATWATMFDGFSFSWWHGLKKVPWIRITETRSDSSEMRCYHTDMAIWAINNFTLAIYGSHYAEEGPLNQFDKCRQG